ncbi:uncharacterized protein EV154DRAFT_561645 [Mucor mucedo]|uniref:uncharacterized protein n=1 Tax=Mucor mucedo TaxID=29922 RepID=UPI00221FB9A4|nr:uncharacterized protein EV154DRAFT_561645 [Mucor mucedo]KAI7893188.1 hypothetical protein EV154DRAFT_561645 [Mucor mucedo]
MRKRDQQQPLFFLDIFEPPPQWRTTATRSNNGGGNAGYHAHSPTHRSPIHHQPSLSEIVYQDYNSNAEIQDDSSGSDARLHGFENSSLSLHTVSTSEPNDDEIHHYDDIEDDEGVDKNAFQRHQSDNVSITNSLFTAVDHLEDDDNSSTENLRHGYLPQIDTILENNKSINAQVKKLNVKTSIVWQDYRPQYQLLNESYDDEIYSTIEKMQAIDHKFNQTRVKFQLEIEKEHVDMSNKLLLQCKELSKEKENAKSDTEQEEGMRFQSEKVRLNVGGNIFETSLSTLRRDTNSLLATMFSGKHPIMAESDGSYFIDRDPSHFRLVLNYLRDLRIPPTILQDVRIRQELFQEAKYYSIDGLVKILQ